MKKIKVRFAEGDVAFLQQQVDAEEINQISITRRELESLVDFFRSPTHGRFGFYCARAEPLVISYNGDDYSYVIERNGVGLTGFRFPPGVEPPSSFEPTCDPKPQRSIVGFMRIFRPTASQLDADE